ncbi:BPI fold-containing family C protein-like [Colius striatus]|uniref:BPI fold-containing family C protein-like n=1 Tax=Colius striatus TaxID=57412 RepID=UPI002B1E7361|nr:BPI fold-containing family C protein-like [Colius striatus]
MAAGPGACLTPRTGRAGRQRWRQGAGARAVGACRCFGRRGPASARAAPRRPPRPQAFPGRAAERCVGAPRRGLRTDVLPHPTRARSMIGRSGRAGASSGLVAVAGEPRLLIAFVAEVAAAAAQRWLIPLRGLSPHSLSGSYLPAIRRRGSAVAAAILFNLTGPCDKGEKMLKTWHFFVLYWVSLRLEANPGIKVRITQKGLDYGRRIGMELLKQAVLKETFPSWSGQESFLVVKVNYEISRLRVNTVDFPETSATFIPGTGISLSVAHASATASADWRANTWLLKDQGGITVSISELFIAVIFKVARDSTGHLSMLLHDCQLNINSVKVKLNGGTHWIYSFLSGYLEKLIHTELDKNICLNIKHIIQMIDAHLRKHKVLSQIDAFAQIDYSLVNSPAVFKSHIDLDLKGTVYSVGNHIDPPFVPASFALPNQDDSMLYLGVSSYFLNSASLAYYRAGAFNITVSKKLSTTFNLNTTLLKDFVPEIPPSYAAACPVLLKLTATSPPAVSLNADRCILQITGSIEVLAVLPNSTTWCIFTGNLTASTRAILTITKQKLIISLLLKRLQFSLLHSTLDFSEEISLVENFLSYALQSAVMPVINDELGKGFPLLNLTHTCLTGPAIKMNQGHLVISTDVHYKHEERGDEDLYF